MSEGRRKDVRCHPGGAGRGGRRGGGEGTSVPPLHSGTLKGLESGKELQGAAAGMSQGPGALLFGSCSALRTSQVLHKHFMTLRA